MTASSPQKGFTLAELLIAVTIVAVLVSFAVPRYQVTMEQAHLNFAASRLRCIATAQRLYHAEADTFASDLATLVTAELLTTNLSSDSSNYSFAVDAADSTTFSISATRQTHSVWSGSIAITQSGTLTGSISDGSRVIMPSTS